MENTPKTLREIANLVNIPAKLTDSVIIIVDAQKEYTEGILPLFEIDKSISALADFLKRARSLNVPIIHVVQIGAKGGKICNPDGPYFEIIDAVKPAKNEFIIEKTLPSSFKNTKLLEILEQIGKKDLIITGYMTHMCLNSTVRDATELGYKCTVIEELTTTRDLPGQNGELIPAKTVKAVHLAGLADRFAIILKSSEELE